MAWGHGVRPWCEAGHGVVFPVEETLLSSACTQCVLSPQYK